MSDLDFIVEDYKLALSHLQGQFQRLWQRFNFFLTVQLALFGLVGVLSLQKGMLKPVPLVCMLGVAVCVIWFLVAAEDRFLVTAYRERVKAAAARIGGLDTLKSKGYEQSFIGIEANSGFSSPLEWYWRPVSITRLPVWLAIGLGAVWIALLVNGEAWLKPFLPAVAAT